LLCIAIKHHYEIIVGLPELGMLLEVGIKWEDLLSF